MIFYKDYYEIEAIRFNTHKKKNKYILPILAGVSSALLVFTLYQIIINLI